ncbi:MAG: ABC transporter ATP-binding protein [Bacteroidia bacterium]|nr:ABC transporter ATP-binding protein [Bacteroidia bacterium]
MTPVLACEELTVGYGTGRGAQALLEPFSASVPAGAFVALLGLNGTGKSTLLRTLAGLQRPLGGSLRYNGMPIGTPTALARHVAVVLPPRAAPPLVGVYATVALGRYPYRRWLPSLSEADTAAIEAALAATGTQPLAHRRLDTLSDGERQRVFIARALAQATPLLLLDEPTAHLDPRGRHQILHLLAQLAHTQGKAIVAATHEVALAQKLAHELWLIADGGHIATLDPAAPGTDQRLAHRFEVTV